MGIFHQQMVQELSKVVSAWEGVSPGPHRFGGVEWRLGRAEIGHAHTHGLVDVPYTRLIRDVLLAEGTVEPHHFLPDSGWISFKMREVGDVDRAIWLLRLSYIHKGLRRLAGKDFIAEIESLRLSEPLRRALGERRLIFDSVKGQT